jgi:hypothetical protein
MYVINYVPPFYAGICAGAIRKKIAVKAIVISPKGGDLWEGMENIAYPK